MESKNSECCLGFLHDYMIVESFSHGVVERCTKCLDTRFFKNDIPNYIYLGYHIKSVLQPNNKRYVKEYPNYGQYRN